MHGSLHFRLQLTCCPISKVFIFHHKQNALLISPSLPTSRKKRLLRTEAGSGAAPGLGPNLPFHWTWEWAAVQILCALPSSSPSHPGPASLSRAIHSRLSRPALLPSQFLGGRCSEGGGGGGSLGAALRELSSRAAETAIPKKNTRGRQDVCGRGRGSARWFLSMWVRPWASLCVCVSVHVCTSQGCLGGMCSEQHGWCTPESGTPSVFLMRTMLDMLLCVCGWGGRRTCVCRRVCKA